MRLVVRAADLQPGDVLCDTQNLVLWAGQTAQTPSGKVTIHLFSRFARHWGKGTRIAVERDMKEKAI